MKKHVLLLFSFFALVSTFTLSVKCESVNVGTDFESVISDEYRELISSLDPYFTDKLPNTFGSSAENDAAELSTWQFLLSMLGKSFTDALSSVLPSFAKMICLIALTAILKGLTGLADGKSAEFISLVSTLCISSVFVLSQYNTVTFLLERLSDISSLASCLLPILVTLYCAGGNTAAAGVGGAGLSVFVFSVEQIFSKLAFPVFGSMLCLVSVSASGALKLDGFIRSLKRTYTNFITLVMSVFCAALASQSLIAGARDSVSLRAAKFITSSSVPIVGSSVGETLKTFAAGVGLLRKSIGIIGIVMILILTLPTIILLLLQGKSIELCASFAETLGCSKEKSLLDGISGIYGCLTASVSVVSVMLAFMLVLFSVSSVAIA